MPSSFKVSSRLAATPAAVWAFVSTFDGVNAELAPWFRMTAPGKWRTIDPEHVPLRKPLFRSWILLGGLLPVDYDYLAFDWIDPPYGFGERSSMLSIRVWSHTRRIRPLPGGCEITDQCAFKARLRPIQPPLAAILRALFRHRHGHLRKRFGTLPET
jgi:ligand-binding SRPBCC domain-containing protein